MMLWVFGGRVGSLWLCYSVAYIIGILCVIIYTLSVEYYY